MDLEIPRLLVGEPLRGQVQAVLEDLIVRRVIPPGTHLSEKDLAERLGVSRNPVREALHVLEREGWVELRPRQGAFAIVPDPEAAEAMFEVRRILEAGAAALAAQRIMASELADLEELLEMGREAVARGDSEAVVALNTRLHRTVASATRNPVLQELLAGLEKRVVFYFSAVATARGQESWREHEELVAALGDGDAERSAELMSRHTEATRAAYRRSAQTAEARAASS